LLPTSERAKRYDEYSQGTFTNVFSRSWAALLVPYQLGV
jgi:hypothetical protein